METHGRGRLCGVGKAKGETRGLQECLGVCGGEGGWVVWCEVLEGDAVRRLFFFMR